MRRLILSIIFLGLCSCQSTSDSLEIVEGTYFGEITSNTIKAELNWNTGKLDSTESDFTWKQTWTIAKDKKGYYIAAEGSLPAPFGKKRVYFNENYTLEAEPYEVATDCYLRRIEGKFSYAHRTKTLLYYRKESTIEDCVPKEEIHVAHGQYRLIYQKENL